MSCLLAAYRPLFEARRSRRLVATSSLGRAAAGSMVDLPLIVLAQEATGSYAIAGAALGARALGVGLSAPLRGRLVDRRGARAALPPFVLVTGVAIAALPLAAQGGPRWSIVVLAAITGLSVPAFAATMRLEWQYLLGVGDPRLDQAYAFESATQVAIYIVGPLFAGAGIAALGAAATLAVTAALAFLAGTAFALQASGARRRAAKQPGLLGPLRLPGLRTLVLVAVLADAGLGGVEVTVVGFAESRGHAGAAGALLALFAASSALGGTLYGARSWRSPPAARLSLLTGACALALLPLALASSLLVLVPLLILAGSPFTAQWAATSVVLDGVVPAASAAEAYNWLSTANGAGVALGGLIAGAANEVAGTAVAFLASAGVIALAAATACLQRRNLSGGPPPREIMH